MDGVYVEIAEEIAVENIFMFGMNVDQVNVERTKMYNGFRDYVGSRLRSVFDTINCGTFGGDT